MMKLFRKYNKQILVGLVVFLMIVFLGGDALQGMLTPNRNMIIATSKYGSIRLSDQDRTRHTTQILERMGFNWNQPAPGLLEPYSELDWILLTREAESFGAIAAREAVNAWMGTSFTPETFERLSRNLRARPADIHDAMRKFQAVQIMAKAVGSAAAPSLAEIRQAAASELDKVSIKAIVLPAEPFVDVTKEFSDGEIKAHFEKYKNARDGDGLSFGYLVPQTVRIQYIKIDRKAVAAKIGVPNLEAKAKAYYDGHKELFRRPMGMEPPPPPPGEEDCAEDDPRAVQRRTYLQWDEDEAQLIATDVIRNRAADEMVTRMADWILPQLSEEWATLSKGKDGYPIAPAALRHLNRYQELIARVPSNLSFPGSLSVVETDFFPADKAREIAEIGEAAYRTEKGTLESIRTIPFRNKVLVPRVPTGKDVDPSNYLALYQTSRYPLSDTSGNVYILRVIDARDEHPPASVDEVRANVISDLRLLAAFDVARQHALKLIELVKQEGKTFREAFDQYDAIASAKNLPGGFFEPPPFSKVPSGLGAIGRKTNSTFVQGNVGRIPNEVVDALFDMEGAAEKFASFEMPERAAMLVTEFLGLTRGREDEFEKIRERIAQSLADQRQQAALREWFKPENIQHRTGFAWVTTKSEQATDEEASADATP